MNKFNEILNDSNLDIDINLNNQIKKGLNSIKVNKGIKFENNIINTTNIEYDKNKRNIITNKEKSTNKTNNKLIHSLINKKKKRNKKRNKKINEIKVNYNESELNMLDYIKAKKFDKRSYIEFYFSLIKTRHPLISSFLPNIDYNPMTIKICLLLFSFALAFILNTLFFTDKTMYQIYEDEGIFNFIYNIPKIIYSTLISTVIDILMKKLALSQESFLEIKNEKEKKAKDINDKALKAKKIIIIKFILFFIISVLLLSLFWFYIGCFCAVYRNTQIYLLKDTLLSFLLSLIIPFLKFLLPCIIKINLVKESGKCFYNLSKLLQ